MSLLTFSAPGLDAPIVLAPDYNELTAHAWDVLPEELLLKIGLLVQNGDVHRDNSSHMRLVCKSWRRALPLGALSPVKLWSWDEDLAQGLAHTKSVSLEAPLTLTGDTALTQLRSKKFHSLHSLSMQHIAPEALPAVGNLTSLHRLRVRVAWGQRGEAARPHWLDWVRTLTQLADLEIEGAVLHLLPEEGLTALVALKQLKRLRLADCLVLTDAGAAAVAKLPLLQELEVTPSRLAEEGVTTLATALPALKTLRVGVVDAAAAGAALGFPSGSLVLDLRLHHSDASSFWTPGAALPTPPAHLAITNHMLSTQVPPAFLQRACAPAGLQSLSLQGVVLGPQAVAQLAVVGPSLRHLSVELHHTVRDDSLLTWTALTGVRSLKLRGTWWLSEGVTAAVLSAMPAMEDLELRRMQGGVDKMLGPPLAKMKALRRLKLSMCRVEEWAAMSQVLASVGGTLQTLSMRWCGGAASMCTAVAQALPHISHLSHLQVSMEGAADDQAVTALACAVAACPSLVSLDVDARATAFAAGSPGTTAPVPEWQQLAAHAGSLRSLTVCASMGWEFEGFAAVCAAATGLRALALRDGRRRVEQSWLGVVGSALPRLGRLDFEECLNVEAQALEALHSLTACTQLRFMKCPGLADPAALEGLRGALPALLMCNSHN